jgi:hypothetical protein
MGCYFDNGKKQKKKELFTFQMLETETWFSTAVNQNNQGTYLEMCKGNHEY